MTQNDNLKATELRIGNYIVDYEAEPEKSIYFKVEEIQRLSNNKAINQTVGVTYRKGSCWSSDPEPIPLTEEWLIKFGFENWGLGTLYINEFESYKRFVLYNVLDGTSNFEVHYIKSTYGNTNHYQYVISCDEDDRINWGEEIKHVHQLQNLYFALTQKELIYE